MHVRAHTMHNTGNCGTPMAATDISIIIADYNSTLEDTVLQYRCIEGFLPAMMFTATCYRNGSWIPNPDNHTCTTASSNVTSSGIIHSCNSCMHVSAHHNSY